MKLEKQRLAEARHGLINGENPEQYTQAYYDSHIKTHEWYVHMEQILKLIQHAHAKYPYSYTEYSKSKAQTDFLYPTRYADVVATKPPSCPLPPPFTDDAIADAAANATSSS